MLKDGMNIFEHLRKMKMMKIEFSTLWLKIFFHIYFRLMFFIPISRKYSLQFIVSKSDIITSFRINTRTFLGNVSVTLLMTIFRIYLSKNFLGYKKKLQTKKCMKHLSQFFCYICKLIGFNSLDSWVVFFWCFVEIDARSWQQKKGYETYHVSWILSLEMDSIQFF